MQYLNTRRLLLAKHLLTESALPVAHVALAAVFQSLRRFNAAFVAHYRMSPSRLRGAAEREPAASGAVDAVTVTLGYRAPCDHTSLLGFFAQRAIPGIGPWTAHYIAMRALGWPDAFPPRDAAVLKAMQRRFGTANQRGADARAEAWRPWRAYAVLRLWNSLETGP